MKILFLLLLPVFCDAQQTGFTYNERVYHNINPNKIAEYNPARDSLVLNKKGDTGYVYRGVKKDVLRSDTISLYIGVNNNDTIYSDRGSYDTTTNNKKSVHYKKTMRRK